MSSVLHATEPASAASLWSRERVAAWCIVPYDAAHRDSAARARMLQELGLTRLAYDYRDEHVATFDLEIETMQRAGIEIVAWWFPVTLDDTARTIIAALERHHLRPQWWISGWDSDALKRLPTDQRVEHECARLRPLVTEARRLGCAVALYNHGGWFGEPANQLAVLAQLRREGFTHIGLVYNFHHGHDHIADFAQHWSHMQADVLAVNLNGMVRDGDRLGRKIVYLGEGDEELAMMRVIERSGWRGLVGVLNHHPEVDAAVALRRNLDGLEALAARLRAEPP